MRRRASTLFLLALTALLVAAPSAVAADGMGLVGRTNDKMITFFCFGVMVFFTVLIIVASAYQGYRENRKERLKADRKKLTEDA